MTSEWENESGEEGMSSQSTHASVLADMPAGVKGQRLAGATGTERERSTEVRKKITQNVVTH